VTVLARASVVIGADIGDLNAGLALVREEMQEAGRTLGELGRELSLKVTLPLVALGTASVHAFGEQEDAIARVNAVLAATGNVAGTTTSDILALASSLQTTTRFADETVVAAAGLLATFQNVRNEVGAGNDIINRAVRDATDLASIMGANLSTAALQLGRALEDPTTGLMLLRRAGIQFSAAERAQIKILMEHGNVLEAQRLILGKVEGKMRDAAKVMAETPFGAFRQAWNAINDVMESVGREIAATLVPLAHGVRDLAVALKSVDPAWVRLAVIMGTALAVIGPLFLWLGELTKAWVALKAAGLLAILPTLALVVAALAALTAAGIAVVQNWVFIKIQAVALWTLIKDVFFTGIEFILDQVAKLSALGQSIPALAQKIIPGLGLVTTVMRVLGDAAAKMRKSVGEAHEGMLAAAGATLSKLEDEYDRAVDKVGAAQQKLVDQLLAKNKGASAREPPWLAPTLEALDKLKTALEGAAQLSAVLGESFDLSGAQAAAYQSVVQALQAAHVDLDLVLDKTGVTLRKLIERMQSLQQQQILEGLEKSLHGVAQQEAVLGDRFSALDATISALEGAVQGLIAQHVALDTVLDQNGTTLRGMIEELDNLKRKAEISAFAQAEAGKALDAFVDFTFGAKQSLAEFIQAAIRDLAKFFLKLALLRAFQFDIKAPAGVKDLVKEMAGGGFLPGGGLALVGEAGPELVQAGRAGMTVTPLSAGRGTAPAAGGGGMEAQMVTPVHITIQAMDSRDMMRALEEHEGTIANIMFRAVQRSSTLRRALGTA
jgi:uncharacterized coiled-coil protein SlyX